MLYDIFDQVAFVAIADNEVIASALARAAADAGDVDPDNSVVTVSHRRAVVTLTPTSGIGVSRTGVEEAVAEQLDDYGLRPSVRPRIIIEATGKVGA